MNKPTLHIYTRVSTQTQQDVGTSLESQKQMGIEKAKELGFKHKVWNEGGASSNYEDLNNRPVLLSLLSDIEEGHIQHLWVFNNDRLSRNDVTAQTIRLVLQKYSVTLYTQSGQFDLNNPHDKLMKTIFDGLAQYDNALRAERTRLGKVNRIKRGYWMGGPPPFGFKLEEKRLALHPEESKWVKKIYEWYAGDKSIEWIKSELDKNGVKTRREVGLWTLGSLRKILKNTHPIGQYNYIDSKTGEVIKCSCPSIISEAIWETCQNKRKETLQRKGQNNRTRHFYLLRSLLYCGHCGSPISGRIRKEKNEYLYFCPNKQKQWVKSAPKGNDKWKRGNDCGMSRSMNIPAADKLISTEYLKFMSKNIHEITEEEYQRKRKTSAETTEVEIKQLQNKQKRLEKEQKGIINNIAEIETAILLKQRDTQIADKILKNLNECFQENKNEISQCKRRIHALKTNRHKAKYTPKVSQKTRERLMIAIFAEEKDTMYRWIRQDIEKIEAFYNKEAADHTLTIHFKIPLEEDGNNKKSVRLKKNKTTG